MSSEGAQDASACTISAYFLKGSPGNARKPQI